MARPDNSVPPRPASVPPEARWDPKEPGLRVGPRRSRRGGPPPRCVPQLDARGHAARRVALRPRSRPRQEHQLPPRRHDRVGGRLGRGRDHGLGVSSQRRADDRAVRAGRAGRVVGALLHARRQDQLHDPLLRARRQRVRARWPAVAAAPVERERAMRAGSRISSAGSTARSSAARTPRSGAGAGGRAKACCATRSTATPHGDGDADREVSADGTLEKKTQTRRTRRAARAVTARPASCRCARSTDERGRQSYAGVWLGDGSLAEETARVFDGDALVAVTEKGERGARRFEARREGRRSCGESRRRQGPAAAEPNERRTNCGARLRALPSRWPRRCAAAGAARSSACCSAPGGSSTSAARCAARSTRRRSRSRTSRPGAVSAARLGEALFRHDEPAFATPPQLAGIDDEPWAELVGARDVDVERFPRLVRALGRRAEPLVRDYALRAIRAEVIVDRAVFRRPRGSCRISRACSRTRRWSDRRARAVCKSSPMPRCPTAGASDDGSRRRARRRRTAAPRMDDSRHCARSPAHSTRRGRRSSRSSRPRRSTIGAGSSSSRSSRPRRSRRSSRSRAATADATLRACAARMLHRAPDVHERRRRTAPRRQRRARPRDHRDRARPAHGRRGAARSGPRPRRRAARLARLREALRRAAVRRGPRARADRARRRCDPHARCTLAHAPAVRRPRRGRRALGDSRSRAACSLLAFGPPRARSSARTRSGSSRSSRRSRAASSSGPTMPPPRELLERWHLPRGRIAMHGARRGAPRLADAEAR